MLFAPSLDAIPSSSLLSSSGDDNPPPPPPLINPPPPREVCVSPRSSFSEASTTSPTGSSFSWSTTSSKSSSTRTSFSEEPSPQNTTFPRRRTSTRLPPSPSTVRPLRESRSVPFILRQRLDSLFSIPLPVRRHQSLPSSQRGSSGGPPTPTSFIHDPPSCPIPPSLLKSPLLTSEKSPFSRRATLSAGGAGLALVGPGGGGGGGTKEGGGGGKGSWSRKGGRIGVGGSF